MLKSVRLSLSFLTRRQQASYVALVAFKALTGILDVAGIALIGLIASVAVTQFNQTATAAKPTVILGITIPKIDGGGLLILVVLVLAVFIVKAAAAITLSWRLTRTIANIEGENAGKIANYLLRGSLDFVKGYSKGEFQYAMTGSTTYAFTGLLNNIATLGSEGFLLIIVATTFFLVNPIAALFAIVYFAIVIFIIQVFIGRSLKRAGQEAVVGTVLTTNAISDTMDTFREISVLAKQPLFIERIHSSRLRVARSGATMTFLSGMPRYVVETALMLGVVLFVGQQFLSGQLATGIVTVGVFLTGGVRIMASLLPLQSALGAMKNNGEQAELAQKLLLQIREREAKAAETPVEKRDLSHVHVEGGTLGLPLALDNVTYRYPGDDHDTLHGISLTIEAGQHVAIIGPSGAGKTTMVDLILGLVPPSSGTVRIGGEEPTELRAFSPGIISYVPQKPGLVSGSIAENIALGIPEDEIDRELLEDVLHRAYLTDFMATLPDGVDTSVGKQVDSLSGGQIQRIGLARALYAKPRFLILDEATSGLDAGSEAFISDSLRELQGRVTVVIIAHRLSTVQHSDMVHVVEAGRVTASDKFKALQKKVPMVAEYVKLMSFESNDD